MSLCELWDHKNGLTYKFESQKTKREKEWSRKTFQKIIEKKKYPRSGERHDNADSKKQKSL